MFLRKEVMYGKGSQVRFHGWGWGSEKGISVCFWRWSRWISVIWALSLSLFPQVEWAGAWMDWRSDRQVQRWGGEFEGNRHKTRITTRGGRGGGRREWNNPVASVSGERRWWRGGSWIPSMQAEWNGWGSSGLSARCPRARETVRDTARETRIGSAVTPPPRLTGRKEPVACPLRNPTAPAKRSRPLTMTLHECCSEAESRRWSTRKVQSTAGQVSNNKRSLSLTLTDSSIISLHNMSQAVLLPKLPWISG